MVLLKGFDNSGFTFFTNYSSHKGKDIEQRQVVCMNFFWVSLQRQIRITGKASKITTKESLEYFKSRPRGSRIGAWVSPQSEIIPNRDFLESKNQEIITKFENTEELPKPDHWGGYRISPTSLEFWQGRPSRLHDRLIYTKESDSWKINRLAP